MRQLFLSALMRAWRTVGKKLPRMHYKELLRRAGWTGIWVDLPKQLLAKELDLSHPVLSWLNGQRALWYLILWQLAREKRI
jgi:hypothetical protein